MRIGILGLGPSAILLAKKIITLGARPVLFGDQRQWNDRDVDDDTLKLEAIRSSADIYDYVEVIRFGKKFLSYTETIPGKSRLIDLFQIVYERDPKEGVLQQVAENPEIFKKLGPEVLASLQEPIEEMEDVDILVDARHWVELPGRLGSRGGWALNEQRWQELISYSKEPPVDFATEQELTIVLDDEFSSLVENWVVKHWQQIKRLHIICSDSCELKKIEELEDRWWNSLQEIFYVEIHKWKGLEDYEKAKTPRPSEPEHKVYFYKNYTVISVDKLFDRNDIFVTLERPAFMGGEDLKTIGADHLWCLKNLERAFLQSEEPGLYYLKEWGNVDEACEKIIDKFLCYFSPVKESDE